MTVTRATLQIGSEMFYHGMMRSYQISSYSKSLTNAALEEGAEKLEIFNTIRGITA